MPIAPPPETQLRHFQQRQTLLMWHPIGCDAEELAANAYLIGQKNPKPDTEPTRRKAESTMDAGHVLRRQH